MGANTAAVVTVGTELVTGLQYDTNSADVAAALTSAGLRVVETASTGDDEGLLAELLTWLTGLCDLVVVTGGLGPTHDDITREAACRALSRPLGRDEALAERLRAVASRHRDPEAAAQVYRQADVLDGATVLPATVGTAPGQVVPTPRGHLVLLPGPPREMRPMLDAAFGVLGLKAAARPVILGTTGLSESDVQVVAQRVLAGAGAIGLTVLARPGEVRVVLVDEGAGAAVVSDAGERVCDALGDACFSAFGDSLPAAVLGRAELARVTIATAESCTGGMVAAALTDVPGSSAAFLGGVVAYDDALKSSALGVKPATLAAHGAVSKETALEMAAGARRVTGADWALSTTGIAGPGGGTASRPVGLVWFGLDGPAGASAFERRFPGDRTAVRMRATAAALDLLRLAIVRSCA